MAMKVVNLTQGTPEWLAWRREGVGGSEAPIIMGVSPWSTVTLLWMRKLGLAAEQPSNPAMQRGHDLEPVARAWYEARVGEAMLPITAESGERSFVRASFDGLSVNHRRAVEIKHPSAIEHAMACWGKVPEKYYPQLQHQLYVAELDGMDYLSSDGNSPVVIPVRRDQRYIDTMLEAEDRFMAALLKHIPPVSSSWDEAAARWLEAEEAAAYAKSVLAEARDALKAVMPDGLTEFICAGVVARRIVKPGHCDYDALLAHHGIDLKEKDNFRKWSNSFEIERHAMAYNTEIGT